MKQRIQTNNTNYLFNPLKLNRRKIINKKIAGENLLVLRSMLLKANIRWGIVFGTLLGAVREKDFIAYDEDVDILVFREDQEKIFDLIHELNSCGFKIARYEEHSLLSIIRKNEYIDIYLFKKTLFGRRCLDYYIPGVFLRKFTKIKFLKKNFPTINKVREYLVYQYGLDWKVPKKNQHAKPNIFWKKVVIFFFPTAVKAYHSLRAKKI
jgi:lipopolysaccharide cholinephosphotransferase